jgi:hypothetical protein
VGSTPGCIVTLGDGLMEQIVEARRAPEARTVGVVYLLYFLTAFFGAFLRKDLWFQAMPRLPPRASWRMEICIGLVSRSA